jgi:hypothetical protein
MEARFSSLPAEIQHHLTRHQDFNRGLPIRPKHPEELGGSCDTSRAKSPAAQSNTKLGSLQQGNSISLHVSKLPQYEGTEDETTLEQFKTASEEMPQRH